MKTDSRTTRLLRRLGGQLFRASRLLEQPDVPWRRRRLLDSLAPHGDRVSLEGGRVLHLTVRVPYDQTTAGGGLVFPGGAAAANLSAAAVSTILRRPALARVRADRFVVLDTETTGLLDEAATVPFLVGLGRFETDAFVLEQFFMEDFESEPAMLKAVARRVRQARALLSYNGGPFDLPLLRRRFALQRLPQSPWKRPHWDVLPTARLLWKGRVRSCSLLGLEQELLGFQRVRDIARNRIPQAYHDYLGGRRAERLGLVFDHNAQDVLTTAALAAMIAGALRHPREFLARGLADEAALARLLKKAGKKL